MGYVCNPRDRSCLLAMEAKMNTGKVIKDKMLRALTSNGRDKILPERVVPKEAIVRVIRIYKEVSSEQSR